MAWRRPAVRVRLAPPIRLYKHRGLPAISWRSGAQFCGPPASRSPASWPAKAASSRHVRFPIGSTDRRGTRFVFKIGVASRDRPLLLALQALLGGHGSIQDLPPAKDHWQPHSVYSINSRLRIRTVVIPFFNHFLLRSAKRDQFDRWRDEFEDYERAHPTQWGKGPSTCSEPGCEKPVRGRGLCRSHYYRATGY